MKPVLLFNQQADMERACARLAASNAPQLALWRACADGHVGIMTILDRRTKMEQGTIRLIERTRPAVVLLGADPGDGSYDPHPAEWASARRLRDWCRSAVIHGTGGEPWHYRTAVEMARRTGRVAFIETTSLRAGEWADFLQCPRALVIIPRDGVHPVMKETVH